MKARPLATLVVAGAVALAGCGGSGPGRPSTATTTTAESQATVRTANCRLWNALGPADRERLLAGSRSFFGGAVDVPGERGQTLPDRRAYALLTSYCRQSFAGAFMLYRLYGNAAAFKTGG